MSCSVIASGVPTAFLAFAGFLAVAPPDRFCFPRSGFGWVSGQDRHVDLNKHRMLRIEALHDADQLRVVVLQQDQLLLLGDLRRLRGLRLRLTFLGRLQLGLHLAGTLAQQFVDSIEAGEPVMAIFAPPAVLLDRGQMRLLVGLPIVEMGDVPPCQG